MTNLTAKEIEQQLLEPTLTTEGKIRVYGDDINAYVDIRSASKDIRNKLTNSIGQAVGHNVVAEYNNVFPLTMFIRSYDLIVDGYERWENRGDSVMGPVFKLAMDVKEQLEALVKEDIQLGLIEYDDLGFLFKVGNAVTSSFYGEEVGGFIDKVTPVRTFFANYQDIAITVIADTHGRITPSVLHLRIGGYTGKKPISELSVQLLTDEVKERLTERGKKFREIAGKPCYLQYQGQLTRATWQDLKTYRANGRVMLDGESFSQVDSNQYRLESYQNGLDEDDHDHGKTVEASIELRDEDLWRTYPFLWGFSFNVKAWGRLAITGLSPIRWREDAFDKLVLDPKKKKLVRALVEHSSGSFNDLIDGKGGGIIFLLHGPPGQGKTLTAEAIAELLHRPLYSVSVGELGTDPESLELKLREVLDIATVWDAVVLIDEADIFLEARDEHDIIRNAMVGVFLRLLEYHQGVLFLTTNRVKNIDPAFYSRISIALHFTVANLDKRRQIWTNLLESAGVTTANIDTLQHADVNGRQIKNAIRISQTLAKADNVIISAELIQEVVDLTTEFEHELAKKGS